MTRGTDPSGPRLHHLANFNRNAGDALLGVVLRDLLTNELPDIQWSARHVHEPVDDRAIARLNAFDGVVIGGGGLLLRDTNANRISGWQWPAAPQDVRRITAPILVFAIGYNKFFGQRDFDPVFNESMAAIVRQSAFFSLRNRGSIRRLQEHLPQDLQERLQFQPCPTTLISHVYPEMLQRMCASGAERRRPRIGFNCAFDRPHLRFGSSAAECSVTRQIAMAMKRLSNDAEVLYIAHTPSDEKLLGHVDPSVCTSVTRLYNVHPRQIIEAYRSLDLMVGMRGHSQMVPFGCGVPILSIVSHPKMTYFLEDIAMSDLAVDVSDPNLANTLVNVATKILTDRDAIQRDLGRARKTFWATTRVNLSRIASLLT